MKTKYLKLVVFWAMLCCSLPVLAQNLITDGSFSTTTSITPLGDPPVPLNTWCSWNNTATVTSFSATVTSDQVCAVDFYNSGYNTWDVQLSQYGFLLEPGAQYKLSFDIKSDSWRSFGVYIGEEGGSWTNLNSANYYQWATPYWETRIINFSAFTTFPLHKLSFEMGANAVGSFSIDNVVLEKVVPKVEIIGTSVEPYDWSAGIDMPSADEVHFNLYNFYLRDGMVKFRQNKDWAFNWGNIAFPSGVGIQDGSNIPIPEGYYDISFNRLTGEYSFVCTGTCTAPQIGVIGTAVPPYDFSTDVKMTSADGNFFTLENIELRQGGLSFIQDGNLNIMWGGIGFPTGTGNAFYSVFVPLAGTYNITYNRLTGVYAFTCLECPIPSVGIIGSAVEGWDYDIDMNTTDGEKYTLFNYTLKDGELKFREDNSWSVNWGTDWYWPSFPSGTAVRDGANIPIPAGTYNIYFYRNTPYTPYYVFEIVCPDLQLQCPENVVASNDAGVCGAMILYDMPKVINECGYVYVYQTEGLPSGSVFPVGTTVNTYTAWSTSGKTATCSFTVTVNDTEPPVITAAAANPSSLWPPDHKMRDVLISYDATDNCGTVTTSLTVTSNEPVLGTGSGDTSPDWMVTGDHSVQLRAERSGTGTGRTYTVTITSTDMAGNTATKTVEVVVPHSMSVKGSGKPGAVSNVVSDAAITLQVQPNPSSAYFTVYVQAARTEKAQLRVFNGSGQQVATLPITTNTPLQFGDKLSPGVYMATVIVGNQVKTVKLVKQ